MLRVMAGLSLGCLIAIGLTAFKKSFTPSSLKKRYGKMRFVFCSLVELASFCTLIKKFLFGRGNWTNSFSVVILFSLLFISLISDGGILSLILNRPIFAKLGCYSYSIYVMQQISFNIMAHTIWKNSTYLYNHTLRSLVISTLLAALLGIIVYHLVEKPCMLLYKKWKNNYIIQQ
jgi:peptidoglycan/LPS O-acetylase OafA/YrhL